MLAVRPELTRQASQFYSLEAFALKGNWSKLLYLDSDLLFRGDIRELWRDGIIPNSIHAPRGMLEWWVDPDSPYHREVFAQKDKKYVMY